MDHLTVRPSHAETKRHRADTTNAVPERSYQMTKLYELSLLLTLMVASADSLPQTNCACCGKHADYKTMTCSISRDQSKTFVSWICPTCLPEAKKSNGQTIEQGSVMSEADIDATLIDEATWLDAELLRRNELRPFIRRPTFAEQNRAAVEGRLVPDGAAVIVKKHDSTRLHRTALPFPFPWASDTEWMAGAVAATEALALLNEIKHGNAEVFFGIANAMTITPEALKRIKCAGRTVK
jgi:hypothetical protein